MANPSDDVALQIKTAERGPSSVRGEKEQGEGLSGLDEKQKALFERYQPIVTRIVYKFSYIGGHKKSEDAWKYYLGLEFKGIGIDDLYQIGQMALIEVIRKIKNKKINNLGAYLFKALYRELKHYITRQDEFTGLDSVYEEWGEPEDPYNMEDAHAHQELKNILGPLLDTLDERRRYVIESLYGFNDTEIKPQKEIGRALGVCYQRVQSLNKSCIKRIRKNKGLMEILKPFFFK